MTGLYSLFILGFLSFSVVLLAVQCTDNSPKNASEKKDSETGDSALIQLEFAEKFSVYRTGNDTIIEIRDGQKNWIKKVSKTPQSGEISFPVNSLACLSTSHLYFFSQVAGIDAIRGVSFAESLNDEEVREALHRGTLIDLTGGSSDYDPELVLGLAPDLFTTYPFGEGEFERLENTGLPTLHFTEYLEKHPLGRVEWIKLAGFLTGKSAEAEAYFQEVKESYMLTKLKAVRKKRARPSVINANGYANKWTAPSGNSLVAHFIKDAGGAYVFEADSSAGNLSLDFEKVYELANSSDYWASVVFTDSISLDTFIGEEDRLRETTVMKDGNIFYCNAQQSDYFGRGILEPHHILSDVFQVLHPSDSTYTPHYFYPFNP